MMRETLLSLSVLSVVTLLLLPADSPLFAACGGTSGTYYCYNLKFSEEPANDCDDVTVDRAEVTISSGCFDPPGQGCEVDFVIEFSSSCYTSIQTLCVDSACTGTAVLLPAPLGTSYNSSFICSCGDMMTIRFTGGAPGNGACFGSPDDCGTGCEGLWEYKTACLNCL